MKVLFVSSGNSLVFPLSPFIKSQGESLKRQGIEIEYFTVVGKGFSGYLKNIRQLKKVAKTYNPDLIHSHYSLSGWISIFADRKKSMVLSLMGSDVHGGNTKTLVNLVLKVQVFLIQFFNKVIIVKSRNLSSVIWAKKKVRLIPNGVNFNVFAPMDKQKAREKLQLNRDKKYLLFAGNPEDSNKNFALLEKARELIQTENIDVLTPYPVPHHELSFYYNACDVLTFPSIKEGSPNVIKEAIACNTKIVATPSGDIIERTRGLKSVFISDYDKKEFAQKINLALKYNGPVNSREASRNEIDEVKIANTIIEIYNKLLNDKL